MSSTQEHGTGPAASNDGNRFTSVIDAVAFAAISLLRSQDIPSDIPEVLRWLGESINVSRVYIFQNVTLDGELADVERFEWSAPGIPSAIDPEDTGTPYLPGFEQLVQVLGSGGVITELAKEAPKAEREWLERDGVLSSAFVPIFVGDSWWGYIGFDDCWQEREWSGEELSALRVAAETIGAALEREELDASLVEMRGRYRSLIETMPAVPYYDLPGSQPVVARAGVKQPGYVAPQTSSILGLDPERWMNQPGYWEDHIHPEDRGRVVDEYRDALASPGVYSLRYRITPEDGEIRWVRDDCSVEHDEEGKPSLVQGVILDITAQHQTQELLREAESRYRTFVEQARDIVIYADLPEEGSATAYVSPQIEHILGVTPQRWIEAEGDTLWLSMVHPEDRDRVEHEYEAYLAGGPDMADYRMVRDDGRTVWIRDRAKVVRDSEGRLVEWGMMMDVTDRVETNQQLREAEERYRELLEQLPAVVYTEDADGRIHYVSPRSGQILGVEAERWIEDPDLWEKLLVPEDREAALALADEHVDTGTRYVDEYRLRRPDGSIIWVRDEAESILDPDGDFERWQGIMIDITEEKRAQELLREAEKRFQVLVEEIPVITYIDSVEGPEGPRYISPQIESLLGYPAEEWVADPQAWAKVVHPDDHDYMAATLEQADRTLEPYGCDYRIFARDGRVVWLHEEARLVTGDDGEPLYWLGVVMDISHRKATEDLEQALAVEKATTAKLRELDELKDQFLTGVSHDLRTPLSSILGFALTLERDWGQLSEDDRQGFLARIAVNAEKLQAFINDLLDVRRLKQGVHMLRRQSIDVGSLVVRLVGQADYLETREVRVETEPVVISADETKVRRMVENLLTNVAKHTPEGTPVWVKVSAQPDGALISVEDAGPGIAEGDKASLFEEFTTGDSARESASPGLGVGLSLVARFAELHGGRAWAEDRPDGGSAFRISLPKDAPTEQLQ